jgi:hypothetical protein
MAEPKRSWLENIARSSRRKDQTAGIMSLENQRLGLQTLSGDDILQF